MAVLTCCCQVEGASGGTSSGTPCYSHEQGIESSHAIQSSLKVCEALRVRRVLQVVGVPCRFWEGRIQGRSMARPRPPARQVYEQSSSWNTDDVYRSPLLNIEYSTISPGQQDCKE